MSGQPQFLASDRHIVTGEVDVKNVETAQGTLRGQSEALVSAVPFRYVFFAPAGCRALEAGFDGKPAAVETASNGLVRVTFTPSQSRINWSVKFRPAGTQP